MKRYITNILISIMIALFISAAAAAETGAGFAADENTIPVCADGDEASDALRAAMTERQESAVICIVTDIQASESKDLIRDIFNRAIAHTGKPDEGDYLRFQYESCDASVRPVSEDTAGAILVSYSIKYYDTAEQESELDEKTD